MRVYRQRLKSFDGSITSWAYVKLNPLERIVVLFFPRKNLTYAPKAAPGPLKYKAQYVLMPRHKKLLKKPTGPTVATRLMIETFKPRFHALDFTAIAIGGLTWPFYPISTAIGVTLAAAVSIWHVLRLRRIAQAHPIPR